MRVRKSRIVRVGIGFLGAVLVALLAASALAGTARAQDVEVGTGTGVIEGQVLNGTSGGPEIGAGIAVTLHTFQGDVELPSMETTTDASGKFRFEGLDTNPELEYWPEAVYLDVKYSSEQAYQFTADGTPLDAVLLVYETTEDDSAVTLDSAHFIMESFGQVLRISEIHLYGNAGDRTYVGKSGEEGRTTLFIPLPDNAVGLAFDQEESSDRYIEVDGGFMDTEPVPPGQETALEFFSYHLVVSGDNLPLERQFAYPVNTLNILVAQPGLALRSDQLQAMGPQSFQGREYDFYALQGLAPDTPLVMELLPSADASASSDMPATTAETDLTAGGPQPGNQGLLRGIGFGLTGLAVAGVFFYAVSNRRPPARAVAAPDLTTNARSRSLLGELADLEEAYAAGKIDDATYERQRAEKYEELKS
jgi:hypothetical protein